MDLTLVSFNATDDPLVLMGRKFTDKRIEVRGCKFAKVQECTFINCHVVFIKCQSPVVSECSFSKSVANAVKFDQCSGGEISKNRFEEPAGQSLTGDIILISRSSGTRDAPIVVDGNHLSGGGPDEFGGGIKLGHMMGSYQRASRNICFDTGSYGIAVVGGHNINVEQNTISNIKHPWSNVGMVVSGDEELEIPVDSVNIHGNTISWVSNEGYQSSYWTGPNARNVVITANNTFDMSAGSHRLP